MTPSQTSSPARQGGSPSSHSSWDEYRRLVEYRLDSNERKLDSIHAKLDGISDKLARLEERHSRAGAIAGAITGFLAGLTGWLK